MGAQGCEALEEYLQNWEEDLWFKIRSNLEWDEASYRRMVQALVECLEATEHQEEVPRVLAFMFVSNVPSIVAMMDRSDFAQLNAGERSPEEAEAYFKRRKQLLRNLSIWFANGERYVKDEQLSVGDWAPTLRSTPR